MKRAWKFWIVSQSSVADRIMKTPLIRRTARSSLKRCSARLEWIGLLAITTPITVTVTRPVSCMIMSATTKPNITVMRSSGAFRYSGTKPRGKAQVSA